jgi:hypothetical protein
MTVKKTLCQRKSLKDFIMELKPLKDREYLLNFIANDKDNETTYEETEREFFSEGHYLFGYEVFSKSERVGVSFALLYGGIYTLDGYSKGSNIFVSVRAGRAVVEKLFKKYTDIVFTEHHKENQVVTSLCKRIGFIDFEEYDDRKIMVMEK